jgi:hypothetical protein
MGQCRRGENAKRRPREYLTVKEVTKLMDGARKRGRYGHRDSTMITRALQQKYPAHVALRRAFAGTIQVVLGGLRAKPAGCQQPAASIDPRVTRRGTRVDTGSPNQSDVHNSARASCRLSVNKSHIELTYLLALVCFNTLVDCACV